MTARWIQVQINSGPNGIVNFPIREDNSVSLSTIDRVVLALHYSNIGIYIQTAGICTSIFYV
jgi:hypothetical protein